MAQNKARNDSLLCSGFGYTEKQKQVISHADFSLTVEASLKN